MVSTGSTVDEGRTTASAGIRMHILSLHVSEPIRDVDWWPSFSVNQML